VAIEERPLALEGTPAGTLEGTAVNTDCRVYRTGGVATARTTMHSRRMYHRGGAIYFCDAGGESDDCIAMEDFLPIDMDDTLEDLLFRDITPEDYELLLQLDEGIARDTVSEAQVGGLMEADAQAATSERCSVCLLPLGSSSDAEEAEGTEAEESLACCAAGIAMLQCRHLFHRDCISKWLLERSRFCPLCGEAAFPPSS